MHHQQQPQPGYRDESPAETLPTQAIPITQEFFLNLKYAAQTFLRCYEHQIVRGRVEFNNKHAQLPYITRRKLVITKGTHFVLATPCLSNALFCKALRGRGGVGRFMRSPACRGEPGRNDAVGRAHPTTTGT
eukprot:6065628-Amphidinium_carterae.1